MTKKLIWHGVTIAVFLAIGNLIGVALWNTPFSRALEISFFQSIAIAMFLATWANHG